jgi:ComF family protein
MAHWFAEIINQKISAIPGDYTIVPSPPGQGKKKKKGWDQVERIASILGKVYGRDISYLLFKKKGHVQKELNLEERKRNMQGRVSIKRKYAKKIPQKIILLDDVFTTGATANECASVLKAGGAHEVISLTLAID